MPPAFARKLTARHYDVAPLSANLIAVSATELPERRSAQPTALRVEIINNVSTWERRRAEIDDLLSTTTLSTPHSTTAWHRAWWEAFGGNRSLCIGLYWQNDQLVGYAPLMLAHERFCGISRRVLRFLGDGISDYADLFSRNDRADVTQAMVDDIVDSWSWEELQLANVRGGSATIAAFQQKQSPRYFSRVAPIDRCLYIDLRDRTFEQYYRTLSRNHRRELQKRRHKLDALGTWSVRFESDAPVATLFDEFRSLHTARSEAMGWSSLYDLAGFREFFASLMQSEPEDLEVLCSTLRHEQRLMSYTLGFLARGVYYHWNIGFDPAYEAIAPNKLHHQFLIEECFRRRCVAFDFMRGAYEYKFKWTDTVSENYGVRLLKRRGWRRPVHRVLWLQEREPDSIASRVIDGARTVARRLKIASRETGQQEA